MVWRDPLEFDEAWWFLRAVEERVVGFRECDASCFRCKKWGAPGPDHFETPSGRPRHLFSKPVGDVGWLNREYIPHLAAYGRAVLDAGYSSRASSFSRYRAFSRDLISRRKGGGFETDAEFYNAAGGIHLQIEAKKSLRETEAVVASVEKVRRLRELPALVAKELEYVLDLAPEYLWIVGPGSIDPATHVYAVTVNGLDAVFEPVDGLPKPPVLT